MIGLGLLHLAVLGIDASPYFGQWATLQLWSLEHWKPLADQQASLLASNAAFWSTLGSFAVPTILLGILLLRLEADRIAIPASIGWLFAAWQLLCSVVMEPAGFVLGLLVAIALLAGLYRQRQSGGRGSGSMRPA